MPLILLSSCVFVVLLVRASLAGSANRFALKLIACAHFVLLGFWAFFLTDSVAPDGWILAGMILSFSGDAALGLRRKSPAFLPLGMILFCLAQLAYLCAMSWRPEMLIILMFLAFSQGMILRRMSRAKACDMPAKLLPLVGLYALSLLGAAALALANAFADPATPHLLRSAAALAFLVSDTILFGVYFIKPTKPNRIIAYLTLYHLAQTLYALSIAR